MEIRGYIGIMEKKMETTKVLQGYICIYMRGNYRDNGKGHRNYYLGSGLLRGLVFRRELQYPW